MRRDKYRQSDEKKFNTLYGSNFSRDTRELTGVASRSVMPRTEAI